MFKIIQQCVIIVRQWPEYLKLYWNSRAWWVTDGKDFRKSGSNPHRCSVNIPGTNFLTHRVNIYHVLLSSLIKIIEILATKYASNSANLQSRRKQVDAHNLQFVETAPKKIKPCLQLILCKISKVLYRHQWGRTMGSSLLPKTQICSISLTCQKSKVTCCLSWSAILCKCGWLGSYEIWMPLLFRIQLCLFFCLHTTMFTFQYQADMLGI